MQALERNISIENLSESPVVYGKGKDAEMLQIRVATFTPDISKDTAIPPKSSASKPIPKGLVDDIQIDKSNITEEQFNKVKVIHEECLNCV